MRDEKNNNDPRILIIDDNAAIHEDFRKILCANAGCNELEDAAGALFGEASGTAETTVYEIDSAHQGHEGLTKVIDSLKEGRPYSLAFVDMRMPPGWDGIETIQRLWREDPQLEVVICTAYSDYSWSEITEQLGRSDQLLILKKPFDNAEICQLAAALTKKHQLGRQARLKLDELEGMVSERTRTLQETNERLKQEIVERERAEREVAQKDAQLRQAQKLEAVGTLAGGIAHEFNNLLQAIRGYTQYAMESIPETEPAYEDLQEVIQAASRATELTAQLLGFSRRRIISPTDMNPNDAILEFEKMLRPVIGGHIELVLHLPGDVGRIHADSGELQQILLNLCINARDAMPDGGRLTVSTENRQLTAEQCDPGQTAKPGEYVALSVTDTGCGMDEDVLAQVFEPFFTTKDVGKGTGLGLSMVYGLVQQHGGAIFVDSVGEQGTTFTIYFPRLDAPEHPDRNADTAATESTVTVLVADDEVSIRRLTSRTLHRAGYRVLEASDGLEALDVFEQNVNEIDVVMLDARMPQYDGGDVARRILDRRPDIGIVVCTAYDANSHQAQSFADLGCHVMTKPFAPAELLESVSRVLNCAEVSPV